MIAETNRRASLACPARWPLPRFARSLPAAGRRRRFEVQRSPAEWRRRLGPARFHILREAGTERAFTSPLLKEKRKGVFACAGCELPLFSSAAKYDSGTGWPSFKKALPNAVAYQRDLTLGMVRTEEHCRRCGGHLGHVFDDGPPPTRQAPLHQRPQPDLQSRGLMLIFLLAYLGGVLTILSPCILPVLPFVFARADRPFLRNGLPLLAGMAITFAGVATLAAVGGGWAVAANSVGRWIAIVLLAGFALLLIFPRPGRTRDAAAGRLGRAAVGDAAARSGIGGSLLLGVATGLLWAPCAGPILGIILTGAALSGASADHRRSAARLCARRRDQPRAGAAGRRQGCSRR